MWNPNVIQCNSCKDIIWSSSPGRYSRCSCGETMIDETEHYGRYGGDFTVLGKLSEVQVED